MTTNLPTIRKTLTSDSMQNMIRQRIGQKAGTFTTSLLDVIGDTPALQQCDPALVVKEALKAAALDLPINKNLGFAYVIPYKERGVQKPQFQCGYKGYVQLALRTGQYRYLNEGVVYEGEEMVIDRIRGTLEIAGKKKSDKPIGFFAYLQLINGFEKAVAWPVEKVKAHRDRFSKSYQAYKAGKIKTPPPWVADFEGMALKTMILQLVPKYGPMTIEMSQAMAADFSDTRQSPGYEADSQANQEYIDIPPDDKGGQDPDHAPDAGEMTDEEKAEIERQEAEEAEGPGY